MDMNLDFRPRAFPRQMRDPLAGCREKEQPGLRHERQSTMMHFRPHAPATEGNVTRCFFRRPTGKNVPTVRALNSPLSPTTDCFACISLVPLVLP